jgi:hypothetical protein
MRGRQLPSAGATVSAAMLELTVSVVSSRASIESSVLTQGPDGTPYLIFHVLLENRLFFFLL